MMSLRSGAGDGRARLTVTAFVLCLGAVCGRDAGAARRFEQFTAAAAQPARPIRIETASYLGGSGTEWLVGGGFRPGGVVVLAGNAVGPGLELPGSPASVVVGKDPLMKPQPTEWVPDWTVRDAAPFVAWYNVAERRIESVARLPWRTGAATDARLDREGNIYLAGLAGVRFDVLGGVQDVSLEKPCATTAYVVKLSGVSGRLLWARTFTDAGHGPKLRLRRDGRIQVEGGWVYVFTSDGRPIKVARVHKTTNWARAVNPSDHGFAVGFDRETYAVREQWRQPHLVLARRPGKLGEVPMREYYAWDPKLMGSDRYRLVAHTTFSCLYYGDDGMLYVGARTQGYRTVLDRSPLDIDKDLPFKGLGFSSVGGGDKWLSHVLKIEPSTGRVLNKTLWCAYLKERDRPGDMEVEHLRVATDGSLLLAGVSGFGLIQTGDALHPFPDQPGGPYFAVLQSDFSALRFSTTLPAAGRVELRRAEHWNTVAAVSGGRHKVLVLCGAIERERLYGKAAPAPVLRAVQPRYGGGRTDGYFMLLDLGVAAPVRPRAGS